MRALAITLATAAALGFAGLGQLDYAKAQNQPGGGGGQTGASQSGGGGQGGASQDRGSSDRGSGGAMRDSQGGGQSAGGRSESSGQSAGGRSDTNVSVADAPSAAARCARARVPASVSVTAAATR
jgi:hypothetical protein